MPNNAVILKLFTKELILSSVPGLREKIEMQRRERVTRELGDLTKLGPSMIHPPEPGKPPIQLPPEFKPKVEAAPGPIKGPAEGPTHPSGINFGKLMPLIMNPAITIIECPGPDKNLMIRTYNTRRPVPTSLSQEEMKSLIEQFAKKAKVPLIDGLFRAWVETFMVSGIVAEGNPQNFIIQKVIYPHFT